jgi:hypothetical protein
MPEKLPTPPPRLRDLVARPRPIPARTIVLVALVPLVAFTIFVIATHRGAPPASSNVAPSSARSSGVIFVVPVSTSASAPPAKSRE